ncbi:MAG TPA: choice-of-anchor Q domain-containing protein [Thermoanaerobaculia bacterium]|jgi:hypothetical protein|nr:choice-of-anchor Q domain-containing protein [Thermoanaerobaculia bacterium]
MLRSAAVLTIGAALACSLPAAGATWTVGPDGAFSTIQAAVDAAVAAGGDNSILVERGTYLEENVGNGGAALTGTLRLLGGWDASFTRRDSLPGATVVDARGLGRALRFSCSDARLFVEGFTLTHGRVAGGGTVERGGGAWFSASGTCEVTLRSLMVHDNSVEGDAFCDGGGLFVQAADDGDVMLEDLSVEHNRVSCACGAAQGGGISVIPSESAATPWRTAIHLSNSSVSGNSVDSGCTAFAAAAELAGGSVEVFDSTFDANQVISTPFGGAAVLLRTQELEFRRNRLLANGCGGSGGESFNKGQLSFVSSIEAQVSDSLIAEGVSCAGVIAAATPGSRIFVTNLTVARNSDAGFGSATKGPVTVANTVVYGNGSDLAPSGAGVTLGAGNLFGIDPFFVDAARGNYHLLAGSPAIDTGDDLPAGGRGPFDLDRAARIQGAHIDGGAYEAAAGAVGTHLCDVAGHGALPNVPAFTQACICLRDQGLRSFHCGFFLAELFVDLAIPTPVSPDELVKAAWTIDPWQGADGAYTVVFETMQKGQWVPVDSRSGKLKQGKLETVKLDFLAPPLSTPLRARIQHRAPGLDKPIEDAIDVLLVVDKPNGP